MFEKLMGKATEVVAKNAAKVVIAIPVAAVATAGALIAQHIHDKKKYTKVGMKKASEIYKEQFRKMAKMFD